MNKEKGCKVMCLTLRLLGGECYTRYISYLIKVISYMINF